MSSWGLIVEPLNVWHCNLGYGVDSVRSRGRPADIDDAVTPGVASNAAAEIQRLEQELRETKRANEVLKRVASFFGAELDRQLKM